MKTIPGFLHAPFLLPCILAGCTAAAATQTTLTAPSGSGLFGQNVQVLLNGNLVVTDPYYTNAGIGRVGAVYLYDGATLALLSTLTGSGANDLVGSGGITVLPNTNFVVRSPGWSASAGAVTWCSGSTGRTGAVSAANSLVGSLANDQVGGSITILSNGNYVVCSPYWSNYAGAVTWCSGAQGGSGTVSAANSLVGSAYNDRIGFNGAFALPNGHYVVASSYWNNFCGAATWCNGTSGRSGGVSSLNSLVGYANDEVAAGGVAVLPNGNYVVCSPYCSGAGGAAGSAGAATWCNGSTGNIGNVGSYNSLVGSTTADYVSSGGIVVLPSGNYVVVSPNWNSTSVATQVGAATWCSGTSGRSGTISSANSLVGSSASDQVGSGGAIVLANGNYVVVSKYWNSVYGAATWCSGSSGRSGLVSSANSLVGSKANDTVGSAGVVPLPTGHYVVLSPLWDNGTTVDVGAATLCNGTSGRSGAVSAGNSLVGSHASDQVGAGGAAALSNGNFVVASPYWRNGTITNAGAVTWCNGISGPSPTPTTANSLVGGHAQDRVGSTTPTALANGNYVVSTPTWGDGYSASVGAVTWCSGTAATSGTVSAGNSLVGSSANDAVGGYFEYTYLGPAPPPYGGLMAMPRSGITALPGGDYLVISPYWNSGGPINGGAITWCDGTNSLADTVSGANSLVGDADYDRLGSYVSYYTYVSNGLPRSVAVLRPRVTVLSDGTCAVTSTFCHNQSGDAAGAVTFGDVAPRLLGNISTDNSVFGTAANGGTSLVLSYDRARQRLAVGDQGGNLVTLLSYRVPQTITFSPIADQQYPGTVDLAATSSSGLPVTFNVLSGPATLATDTQLSLTGAGRVAVVAVQAGDLNTMPAPSITNTFSVTVTVTTNTGTPIWWLMQYGYTDNFEEAALEDLDGDGALNWQEYVAGTDPTDATSVLTLLSVSRNGSRVSVTWTSVTNRVYALERSGNPGAPTSFLTLATNIAGHANTTTYTDTNAAGAYPLFYRVAAQNPSYQVQISHSCIPFVWLQQYGLPTDGSADYADPDRDGRNNYEEWRCGTDPTSPQSVLRLLSPAGNPPNLTLRWQSVTNRSYYLQRCTNLAAHPSFLTLATNIPGQAGTTAYLDTNAPAASRVFYRVGVQ